MESDEEWVSDTDPIPHCEGCGAEGAGMCDQCAEIDLIEKKTYNDPFDWPPSPVSLHVTPRTIRAPRVPRPVNGSRTPRRSPPRKAAGPDRRLPGK